ncbi:hypothetical protein ACTXT7_009356 [Hymenolepis weldensis]
MDPADLTYEKMVSKLGSVVDDNSSLFNLTICEDETVHYPVGVVNRLCRSFSFGSLDENQFGCFVFILNLRSPYHAEIRLRLLFLLDKKSDVKKSRCTPESAGGLLTASGNHSLSDNYPTNIKSNHSQDANFLENVVIIETVLSKTSLPEMLRKWSQRRLLPRIFYERFNEAESKHQESINPDEAEL